MVGVDCAVVVWQLRDRAQLVFGRGQLVGYRAVRALAGGGLGACGGRDRGAGQGDGECCEPGERVIAA